MYSTKTLTDVLSEVNSQRSIKKDYLVKGSTLKLSEDGQHISFTKDSSIVSLKPTELFHKQVANALAIPTKYYDLMAKEKPQLLSNNVNTWLKDKENHFLLRSFDNPDSFGTARAFLSERYHVIDNNEVVCNLLPDLLSIEGLKVVSCDVTDDHLYIKIVNEKVTTDVTPGDTVQSGLVISNSEVGLGAVTIQPLLYRLVCTNGMIANSLSRRKYHVGKKSLLGETPMEYSLYSQETIAADDKALFLKLKDVANFALSEAGLKTMVSTLRESKDALITGKTANVVELTSKEFGLTENEQDAILENLIKDADHSLYGLSNAITKTSWQISNNYERATELERIGWDVATMSSSLWKEINHKAA